MDGRNGGRCVGTRDTRLVCLEVGHGNCPVGNLKTIKVKRVDFPVRHNKKDG